METIKLDRGFSFGIGVFETFAVKRGKVIFEQLHLDRLETAMAALNISNKDYNKESISCELQKRAEGKDMFALKLIVTDNNIVITERSNTWTDEKRRKGLNLCFSDVRRNETSPFTYHKTLHYGDLILEKEKAVKKGFDEPIFMNSKGYITESAIANIFVVKNGKIYTPPISDGLLNGIIRKVILEKYRTIKEKSLSADDIMGADEVFLTNSLMEIMPVRSIEDKDFEIHTFAEKLHQLIL